jgi:CoA-transferase family III
MTGESSGISARTWRIVDGDPELLSALTATGPAAVLPGYFDVTGLATGAVAAALLAAAEFRAARDAEPVPPVRVDSRAACAAFACEGLFTPVGWSLPEIWDPIAGNYLAADGWIRLHTNYAYHRAAVERVLGAYDRPSVQAAVSRWRAADLESAVVAAGGCAATMHDRDAWLASPAGTASADTPPLTVVTAPGGSANGNDSGRSSAGLPFGGVRVLDLTRVIAGPVCTRFLAAYGADVLRLDPPGFAEVPALLPETTAGKRTAALDLGTAAGRGAFESLVAGADVLVTGLRNGALARLGYDDAELAAVNPALIHASLNAYGWEGPWRERRGFDSLVQMSCGIAAAGAAAAAGAGETDRAGAAAGGAGAAGAGGAGAGETDGAGGGKPVPLPVQALDHATGYLLAAAVGRALTRRLTDSVMSRVRASLVGTANLLWSLPRPDRQPDMPRRADIPLVDTMTAWGPARRVAFPGEISGVPAELRIEAGPLGRHEPAWRPR